MRVFVLTAEYGSGHVIAARGIEDALRHYGCEYMLLDVVKAGGILEKLSSWAFELMMRRGHLAWRLFYYNPLPSSKPIRNIYRFVFKDKFMEPLREFSPDVIISTHFLTSLIALIYKTKKKLKIYTVITDLVAHPLWIWEGTDGYFTALSDTSLDLIKYGVEKETIHETGIPLRKMFWNKNSKDEAKKKLGYPDKTTILFSAGSYDSVPIHEIIRGLRGLNFFAVILAGKKREAYDKYSRLLKELKIEGVVYPFVDFVADIMNASDVFITKAGGVSVAEGLAIGLPMIFIRSMPGQEEGNANIMERYGAGINAKSVEYAIEKIVQILRDTKTLEVMRKNAEGLGRPNSSLEVLRIVSEEFQQG